MGQYLCSHCGHQFESGDKQPRCPRCLRSSALVDVASGAAASHKAAAPGVLVWPDGVACPLCHVRPVGEAVFYIQVTKIATVPGHSDHNWITARGQCCDACRAQVERLGWQRWLIFACLMIGAAAWLAAIVRDGPLASTGMPHGAQFAAGTVVALLLGGLPLALFVRKKRRIRRRLEETAMFQRLVAAIPQPDGLIEQEHWNLFASVSSDKVVDLADYA